MPYAFPRINVPSSVFRMLLVLWNPRSHIYGIRQLFVSPCTTARSISYCPHFPSFMGRNFTAHLFTPIKGGLRAGWGSFWTFWRSKLKRKKASEENFSHLLIGVLVSLSVLLNKFNTSYHKTPWVDTLSWRTLPRLGQSLGYSIGSPTTLKSNTVRRVSGWS